MTTLPASEETAVPATDRAAFEKWLMEVHGLDSPWNEQRNCFDDWPAHLAFKAWQAGSEQAVRECAENVWHPIETAPKDGTPILAFGPEPVKSPDYGTRETFWRFYGKGSIAYEQYQKGEGPSGAWHWGEPIHNWASSWKPTHWRPLPTPPSLSQVSAKK